ncbi:hypothetical protein QWY97_10470 [Vibrio cortegadensis]|uniref:hypothetical protein n=1 Tax=Vibrio cortegadensis TaxID=1328770 RepID=UPI0021C2CC7E|nr:hypothetical protein [Vibrio cortegadensis]MDN3697769.1 hypothetical protein [Vibrio cortegadensis]
MEKAQHITDELEQEVQKASKNPFASKLMAPLRLFLVWMKLTNERMATLERQLDGGI